MLTLFQVISYILIFLLGMIAGAVVVYFFYKKQIKNFQKQYEMMNKEQIKNMLSAFGKKPSQEQVNKIAQSMKKDTTKLKRKK